MTATQVINFIRSNYRPEEPRIEPPVWYVESRATGEVLAGPFDTLAAANDWHDRRLDELPGAEDDDFFRVNFARTT